MNKKLPNELNIIVDGSSAHLALYVPEDLFWFQGHFPSQPLLPGVVQLNWAIYYCEKIFSFRANIKSIDVIKFQTPILPTDHLFLHLNLDYDNKKIQFSYRVENKIASSGKITLCQ